MTILCVDDEKLLLEDTVIMCRELPQADTVQGFSNPLEALDWMREHSPDVALLDINMPVMSGLKLAAEIKRLSPDTAVIFLTGYSEYALEAFEVHAVGYLLKPVNTERLAAQIAYSTAGRQPRKMPHVEARTFGNFDLFVDGRIVRFKQAKCKELLAYLIDRNGSDVTRAEAFAILYQDRLYDRPMQKQFDVIVRSLKKTLEEYGISEIFEISHAKMRVFPEKFSCDAYRFLEADPQAVNAYRGEYMNNYSWASSTEGYMHMRLFGE
jgi:two-component SAPR family response regulator